jgi:hypothetical protein
MELTRRQILKSALVAGVGAVAGATGHGYLYERHALQTERATLLVSGLAQAHEGLRVGFLTDFHHSAFVSQAEVAHAVDRVLAERPDLIVLGGDYVTRADRAYMGPCAEALAPLTAPHGVFAILGNHDDDREMPAALAAQRFTVLKDARTTVRIAREDIDLVGIRFWTREVAQIARLLRPSAAPALLLAHDPRRLVQAARLAIPAVLSGHTHGGQVVVPFAGAVAARRFPVVAGLGEKDGTSLFVSRGIGTVYLPLRIQCPPDVAILTLRRRAEDQGPDSVS